MFGVRFEAMAGRGKVAWKWPESRPQNGRSEDLDSIPRTIRFKLESEISIFAV